MDSIDTARPVAPAALEAWSVATLPTLLQRWERQSPDRAAMRQKELGRWSETRWSDLAEQVRAGAEWLTLQGLGPTDVVAILAANSVQWVRWCLAAQAVGALPTAVDPQASGEELESILRQSGARVVIAGGLAQAEDAIELHARSCPAIDLVVVGGSAPPALTREAPRVVAEADALRTPAPADALIRRAAEPSEAAVLLWTAGASGAPRGAILTWENLDAAVRQLAHGHDLRTGDDTMVGVSMAHAEGFAFGVLGLLGCGLCLHFPESADSFDVDLRAVQPRVFVAPARWFTRTRASILRRAEEATPLKRLAIRLSIGITARSATRFTPAGGLLRRGARLLVLGPLHRATGLRRAVVAVCTGGPVAEAVVRGWAAVGVPVTRVYGLTEACGLVARASGPGVGGVGRPYPGVDVQLDDSGAILVKGHAVAPRYVDGGDCAEDGWLRTDDIGRVTAAGDLEIVETSGAGDHAGATSREAALRSLALVSDAVVVSVDGAWYALLVLDESAAASWARRHGADGASTRMLLANVELQAEIGRELGSLRDDDGAPLIDDFRLASAPLSIAAGELTSTHKVRRQVVVDRYLALFKEMSNEVAA